MKQDLNRLNVPGSIVDVVIDTDTYNEVDDQFALTYLLASHNKLNLKAIYAAPFFNEKSSSPEDGMNKSYDEIMRILLLTDHEELKANTYKGSTQYLCDETTPVISPAANDLVQRSKGYNIDNPLYVVAIAAITDIASAVIIDPSIINRIVVVWLGGHSLEYPVTDEFNMRQDIAAARVLFNSGVPLIQLPCRGVVNNFALSYYELEHFMQGKNKICDFLLKRVKENELERLQNGKAVSRVIWDVTAVAWLLNDNDCFMQSKLIHSPIPEYDMHYSYDERRHFINYVYALNRDAIADDLFKKLTTIGE